jgi:mycothiol synthase
VEVRQGLDGAERDEVLGLLEAARRADRHEPMAEHKRLALADAGVPVTAFVLRDGAGRLTAYAQLAPARDSIGVEAVVRPDARGADGGASVAASLVTAARSWMGAHGGGTLRWFLAAPRPPAAAAAGALGFELERRLLHLTVPLPLAEPDTARAAQVLDPYTVRAFRPGQDEEAWLVLNGRAFAHHPEQGGWTAADLAAREAAAWFDPSGLLLAFDGDRLIASCFTKVHHNVEPPAGEIYVIGVDPDRHGSGLGRAMTVAGLAHLASRGLTRGMLYVDEDNRSAVDLYRSLGFTEDHADVTFVAEVASVAS